MIVITHQTSTDLKMLEAHDLIVQVILEVYKYHNKLTSFPAVYDG